MIEHVPPLFHGVVTRSHPEPPADARTPARVYRVCGQAAQGPDRRQ
jgi:hypothetical protein